MRTRKGLLVLLVGVLAAGCSETPLLVGEWVSVGAYQGPQMVYIFEAGGRSRWVLGLEAGPDTLEVPYQADYGADPARLDVGPWTEGPLEGRTLYGIVEFHGPDRFRVDFEPGAPGGGGTARPTEFTSQTVTFVRKRN